MYIPYPDDVLKKLQQEELEILKAFAKLCKKYDIKWFTNGGTLLGTVRHQGFIPWDDDIDVILLKEDYEKFLKIPSEEYEKEYGFISPDTENGYYNFIPKFYKKNSIYITSASAVGGGNKIGIFIEIFPEFYVSDAAKIRKKHYKQVRRLCMLLHETSLPHIINITNPYQAVSPIKRMIRSMVRFLLRLMRINAKKVNHWYVKWWNHAISPVPTNTMAQYCYPSDSESYLISSKNIFPLREMMFEDIKVMVPNQAEQVLKGYYGEDYMKLPPPEKRWNQCPAYIKFSDGTEYDFTSAQEKRS